MSKPAILVILGPTASGKSDLAVRLARKFKGEVVSADSRQVYKGLNIGTSKVTTREMRGIRHHMIDIVSPKVTFTVEQYKNQAQKVIADIIRRGKLPVICGGTGFYIQALVENVDFPNVPPDTKLRTTLARLSTQSLLKKLKKLDPRRAREIDPDNKRRIIRAIEIATALGSVPRVTKGTGKYKSLQIGITVPKDVLRKKIHDRLLSRMKKGMVKEARKLHAGGLSWKRMENLGLEYRYLARYLTGKISKEEMLAQIEKEIWSYARRQMTWFKRDKRIRWFGSKDRVKIEKTIRNL